MEKIRIQKYLSMAGVASRRGAEKDIENGLVTVNGKPCSLGDKVDPVKDTVYYKGRKVKRISEKKTYVILNKPRGYITTLSDEYERKCVADLLKDVDARVYPVGRLDKDSEGILLLTNDGEFANKMMHPSHGISKVYHVRCKGEVTSEQLSILSSRLEIDGYTIRPVTVTVLSRSEESTLLSFELFEGRNRQIRKMCDIAEVEISRLCRISIGGIKLGDLSVGKWRYLTRKERESLENSLIKNND